MQTKLPLETQLRSVASNLRVRPLPLKDFIPLLLAAADELERLQSLCEGMDKPCI